MRFHGTIWWISQRRHYLVWTQQWIPYLHMGIGYSFHIIGTFILTNNVVKQWAWFGYIEFSLISQLRRERIVTKFLFPQSTENKFKKKTGQWITLKNIDLYYDYYELYTWAWNTVTWHWSADTFFDICQLSITWISNTKVKHR